MEKSNQIGKFQEQKKSLVNEINNEDSNETAMCTNTTTKKESKEAKQKTEDIENEILQYKIKNIWAEETETNMIFVKKAICWLKDGCKNNDTFDLLNKLVCLGKILSEDNTSNTANINSLEDSKAEAIKQRLELTNSKENREILSNKAHMGHKALLAKLNKLNAIIANGN